MSSDIIEAQGRSDAEFRGSLVTQSTRLISAGLFLGQSYICRQPVKLGGNITHFNNVRTLRNRIVCDFNLNLLPFI